MRNKTTITVLFVIAALYDGVLGLAFLIAPAAIFQRCGVVPPNHFGYVHFPAALLLVFTVMFAAIAWAPSRNRNLIPYGIMLKICYSGVVFCHWLGRGIPNMWKGFAIADLAFLVLFVMAYRWIGQRRDLHLPL